MRRGMWAWAAAVAVVIAALTTSIGGAPLASAAPHTTRRIAGADRYATAVALSQSAFPGGAPSVVVASGEAFPDALAAGPLAVAVGGPVLLTRAATVPPSTSIELRRLAPRVIYVVGGTAAVSESVFATLNSIAPTTRLAGVDRYRTALAISQRTFTSAAPEVWIAPGDSYPDALLAASAAARARGAVLLAAAGRLPDDTMAELVRLAPRRVMVLGLTVSHDALIQIRSAGFNVRRLAGIGPYATSLLTALDRSTTAPQVFVATSENFPDALAAVAVAARQDAAVLLSQSGCLPETIRRGYDRLGTTETVLVGGTSALGAGVEARVSCGPEGIFVQTVSYRAVYSVPAGVEPDPAMPGAIAHNTELALDWFAAQTDGWRPRFDRDRNGNLIVETVRLTAAESATPVVEALFARAMLPPGTSPVIWHQGMSERQVCGTSFESWNSIVLWMPQCGIYPDLAAVSFPAGASYVVAHELTHSLGAVERCAPHYDGTSHSNDDSRDVLSSGARPRQPDAVTIDPGRDDYYQHGRSDCPDIADSARWEWIGTP